tara:strand:- start:3764 stop:3961 length:198 start_codon:yes stop_codon:yes gene_type:complete
MLEKDEDFYRKFIGMATRARTKSLKLFLEGTTVVVMRGEHIVKKMPMSLFMKMTVDEILSQTGGE